MKDIANLLLLLVVVGLIVCHAAMPQAAADCDIWAMVLCFTAFVVDVSLSLARAFMRRPSLAKAAWSMVFLVLGSVVFLLPRGDSPEDDQDEANLKTAIAAYRESHDPTSETSPGNSAFELAASLGRTHLVREFLRNASVLEKKDLLNRSFHRAAENGHLRVVELLLPHVGINEAVQGSSALVVAAAAGRTKVVERLLAAGADPDLADADGTVPLIHAVLADSAPCVRFLIQHGADATRTDADGRDAASYSHNEEIDALLAR